MKIVNILGGIGNQMFQYAFLVALRESTKKEVCYDASVFKTYPLHNGFELDRRFNISARQASPSEISRLSYYTSSYFWYRVLKRLPRRKTMLYEPNHCAYTPELLEDGRDMYYYGIWQDHRYFDNYKDIVKKEFSWKEILDERNQETYDYFKEGITVSLHIRRGDYLKEWRYKDICELDYYQKALEYISSLGKKDVKFAIFSNDPSWCKDNIVPLISDYKYTMVDWNQGAESFKDMQLMSACKVNVIANSSFSWWGAYLNIHDDVLVIAPRKWTNDIVYFDRQLDDWHLIG